MSPEVKTESELEIAHVLFIDTVGYSKLLINEQREVFDAFNRVVKESDQFRKAVKLSFLIASAPRSIPHPRYR